MGVDANMNGNWLEVDLTATQDIEIYESVKVMQLPLVCCLCYSSFLVSYEIVMDEALNAFNFTISNIESGAGVDVEGERAFQLSLVGDSVSIYDLRENGDKNAAKVYEINGNTQTTQTTQTTVDPQGSKAFESQANGFLIMAISFIAMLF